MVAQPSMADVRVEPGRRGGNDDPVAVARRLVEAVMSKDRDTVVAAFAPAVRFRHLIPRGPREIWGAEEAADVLFGWFGAARELEIQSLLVEPIADRMSVRYRIRLRRAGGWEAIEQQQYLDMDEAGLVAAIDLLCSGFRPEMKPDAERLSSLHRFDAGTMGCADGLAGEFRRQILAIPVGEVLEVTTTDPAAKEDLPPLARMMGHTVRSVEAPGDGRLLITVERGR